MTPPLALDLIDKALAEKAAFLDLGNCGLTAIPEETTKLAPFLRELNLGPYFFSTANQYTESKNKGKANDFSGIYVDFVLFRKLKLTGLYLSHTYLSTNFLLLPLASQLPNLTSLDISANGLTNEGTQNITSQLPNLTSLQISRNELTDEGARHIARQLKNLTSLQISLNQLTDVGAQHIASQLKNLTSLQIWGNELTDVGAQHIASQLKNLTSLQISANQLTDVGAQHIASNLKNMTSLEIWGNELTDVGIELLASLPNLTYLFARGNKTDSIPETLLSDIKALRYYFAASRAKKLVDNNFVKVILMGNTTSGKSSLANYLVDGTFADVRESTHGIKLWKWHTDPENPETDLIVNIWDFGGQDYYHATHTLFRSAKTLFLFLHTDEAVHEAK